MEALLVASGVLLAAQYKRNPAQFKIPSPLFLRKQGATDDDVSAELDEFGCDPNQEYTDPSDPCYMDKNGCRPNQTYVDPENPCWDKSKQRAKEDGQDMAMGPGEYSFYPDDFFYNRNISKTQPLPSPDPARPPPKYPGRSPIPGVINPVQVDMMNDIRTGNNRIPASAHIASAYRPSWVRNVVDASSQNPRQESLREWSTEIPRDAFDKTLPTVTQRYAQHGVATLDHFGKGGLPFDEQIRVRPDGLDPDPTRRLPTARYNTYALGDDLTESMADHGKVPGLAYGQRIEGPAFRKEAWDVMPDRDIQLQPSNAPIPLSGAGVRSGGRGAPLGSFLGAPLNPSSSARQGIEWDHGETAKKAPVPSLPVRPQDDDPLDKRFVYEDIDPTKAQAGISRKTEVPRGPTSMSMVGDKGAWKFSFDMKSLFDMPTQDAVQSGISMKNEIPKGPTPMVGEKAAWKVSSDKKTVFDMPNQTKDIVETVPEKIVALPDSTRTNVKKGTAESKRRNVNIQPKTNSTGVFGATTFKTETLSQKTVISSSDIGVAKNIATEESMPLGDKASGRRVAFERSDAPVKREAINDMASYDNDKIFERGGLMREPMLPSKTDTPDYAQTKIGTMRNGREFRKR